MTTATDPKAQPLDTDTAYAIGYHQVYAPAFFEKLASDFDIRPTSEEEAVELLSIGARLRDADEQQQYKQANESASLIKAASEQLDKALASQGYGTQSVDDNQRIKQAAVAVSQNADVARALLSLKYAAKDSQSEQEN